MKTNNAIFTDTVANVIDTARRIFKYTSPNIILFSLLVCLCFMLKRPGLSPTAYLAIFVFAWLVSNIFHASFQDRVVMFIRNCWNMRPLLPRSVKTVLVFLRPEERVVIYDMFRENPHPYSANEKPPIVAFLEKKRVIYDVNCGAKGDPLYKLNIGVVNYLMGHPEYVDWGTDYTESW